MERLKERRDEYLEGKKDLLLHFLTDNDYFKKKEKREKKGIEKEEKKKKDEAVAAAALGGMMTDCHASSSSDGLLNGNTDNITSTDDITSSLDDAASAMAALCGAASDKIEGDGSDKIEGDVEDTREVLEHVSLPEVILPSVKHIAWKDQLPGESDKTVTITTVDHQESGTTVKDEIVKGENEVQVGEDDDEEDTNVDPPELQVSYAMRGVPLVLQPPTLIAELHEHQVMIILVLTCMIS